MLRFGSVFLSFFGFLIFPFLPHDDKTQNDS